VAHLRRLPSGRWQARYRTPDGKERAQNFPRRIDAERFARSVEVKKDRGEWIDPELGRISLAEWSERYLRSKAHKKPATLASIESLLRSRILPAFGSTPLARLDPMAVQEWLSELAASGLSASRRRQAAILLQAMLRAAVATRHLARNPLDGLEIPTLKRSDQRFLSPAELERLALAAESPYKPLINVLGYLGTRWGETVALRRSRCDLLRSRIEISESLSEVNGRLSFGPTKTDRARSVAVPAFLRDQLAQHLTTVERDPGALVFTAPRGGPLRYSGFYRRVWLPAVERAGLSPLRIHHLRHTAASLLIAQGAGPKAVMEHLGHSSITVTMDRYGHLFPSEFEGLAERLDRAHSEAAADSSRTPEGRVVHLPGVSR
jgi:integrase